MKSRLKVAKAGVLLTTLLVSALTTSAGEAAALPPPGWECSSWYAFTSGGEHWYYFECWSDDGVASGWFTMPE